MSITVQGECEMLFCTNKCKNVSLNNIGSVKLYETKPKYTGQKLYKLIYFFKSQTCQNKNKPITNTLKQKAKHLKNIFNKQIEHWTEIIFVTKMPLFSSEASIHSFLTICPSPIKKGKCYICKEDDRDPSWGHWDKFNATTSSTSK